MMKISWVSYKKLGQQCVCFLIVDSRVGDILLLIKEHKLCYLNYSKMQTITYILIWLCTPEGMHLCHWIEKAKIISSDKMCWCIILLQMEPQAHSSQTAASGSLCLMQTAACQCKDWVLLDITCKA